MDRKWGKRELTTQILLWERDEYFTKVGQREASEFRDSRCHTALNINMLSLTCPDIVYIWSIIQYFGLWFSLSVFSAYKDKSIVLKKAKNGKNLKQINLQ